MRLKIFLLLIFIVADVFIVQAKTAEIVGTVIATDRLFGHIYGSKAIRKRGLIVRVDKELRGEIGSKFILIDYLWRLEDKFTPYESNNATQWNLKLIREKICDSTLARIQFEHYSLDGKITGIFPMFQRTWGIDFEELPFEDVLPCYQLKRDNLSPIDTFSTDPAKIPHTDTEFFVIKNSIIFITAKTPLKIELWPNGKIILTNESDKTITSYAFGCVIEKDGGIIVTDKFAAVAAKLSPNNASLSIDNIGGAPEYSDQLKTCYDKKSKFSVIRADFEDKTVWSIN